MGKVRMRILPGDNVVVTTGTPVFERPYSQKSWGVAFDDGTPTLVVAVVERRALVMFTHGDVHWIESNTLRRNHSEKAHR